MTMFVPDHTYQIVDPDLSSWQQHGLDDRMHCMILVCDTHDVHHAVRHVLGHTQLLTRGNGALTMVQHVKERAPLHPLEHECELAAMRGATEQEDDARVAKAHEQLRLLRQPAHRARRRADRAPHHFPGGDTRAATLSAR